mgnify:CR=1 FL=1
MSNPKVNITLGPGLTGSVVVTQDDGSELDISSTVSAVTARREPNGAMTAELTMPWASATFLGVAAHVPQETRDALVALGWTPPDAPVAAAVLDAPAEEAR